VSHDIRVAAVDDLKWLDNGFDPEELADQVRKEIEEARTATAMPRHWRPVEIDEEQMR
jgi:hypothetical protein